MTIDATQIRVGISGSVSVAPTGSTLPVEPTIALDVAFDDLGANTEDGLTLSPSRSVEKIRAWQASKAVRTIVTEDELSIQFTLMEWNEKTLALALGGGTFSATTGGDTKYVPPVSGSVDERSFVFEWLDDSITTRLVVPRGMVTNVEEITVAKSGAVQLGLTVEVLGSTPDDFILLTDDPNVANV
jgi:hypothetical protein